MHVVVAKAHSEKGKGENCEKKWKITIKDIKYISLNKYKNKSLSCLNINSFADVLLFRHGPCQTDWLVSLFIYFLMNDMRKLRLKLSADSYYFLKDNLLDVSALKPSNM